MLDELAADVDQGYPSFVRHHAGDVYTTALRLSGSRADADDVAQETFIRAYKALQGYDAERIQSLQARAWLAAITVNVWRNALRSAARRPRQTQLTRSASAKGEEQSDVDLPDPGPGPDAAAETAESSARLASLLAQLPEHHRVPVVLRHVVGLSYAEVATALKCPVGTAKANVARGVKQLHVLAAGPDAAEPEQIQTQSDTRKKPRP